VHCTSACIPSAPPRITGALQLLDQPIATAEFLALDTETNGLGGERCELVEVGWVLVGGGELHERFSTLVAPSAPLPRRIGRLTGITPAMLEGAPRLEEVLPGLERALAGRVLVAHNAAFDRRVLAGAFARAGRRWPAPPVLCTVALARALLPLQRERRLAALAEALGIEVEVAHRALPDAETCARILCALHPRLCAHAGTVGDALALLAPRRRTRARRTPLPAGERRGPRPAGERPARLVAAEGLAPRLTGEGLAPRLAGGRPAPRLTGEGLAPRLAGGRPAPRLTGEGLAPRLAGEGPAPRSTGEGPLPPLDFASLPRDPGVYLFRDDLGRPLYVGKSVSIRSRVRAHFAPSNTRGAWSRHVASVEYQPTHSELGALVLENRLIKRLTPPGNIRLARPDDRLLYIRCRLDIPYPILEVAPEPAAGHAVSVGPLRGGALVRELVEQLDSLFGLRHCGRRLVRRDHPSAYGQMGRCLSPCLGDLDPNLYRRRLDAALGLFQGDGGRRLIEHVEGQMDAAAAARRYERAAWLRRRLRRLRVILERVEGVLEATHARPRLLVAAHPTRADRRDAFWLVGGRLIDWGPLPEDLGELAQRTAAALARGGRRGELGAHLPREEVDEVRLLRSYMASHPDLPQLELEPEPGVEELRMFISAPPPGVAGGPAEVRAGEGSPRVGGEQPAVS